MKSRQFPSSADMAIVALNCKFPGAEGLDQLWTLLIEGRTAVGTVPADRWDKDKALDPVWNVPAFGAFLEGIREFDPLFFGISAREAGDLDPQQRLLLEVSYRMFEQTGVDFRRRKWRKTGVFVGSVWHDYELLRKNQGSPVTRHAAVGQADDVLSSRLSYFFGFQGPSLTVHTGCSASLTALHLAAEAIRSGSIDQALVAGVNLILTPDVSTGLTAFGGLSADGTCKAFDESANGFVRGEGVATLLLMPLQKARDEGLPILAMLAASAVNNDGGGESFVSPNILAQTQLLRDVYAQAGVSPDHVDYIETHGTGTKKGDPVEASALGRFFHGRQRALPIGSIKTNLGHLEGASGLAGVFKACLILQNRMIPPSLHFKKGNRQIRFEEWNLDFATEARELDREGTLVVGVNSFGWGGTNAHVVLCSAPSARPSRRALSTAPTYYIPLSAPHADALRQRTQNLLQVLETQTITLGDLSYTLAKRSPHFPARKLFEVTDLEDLKAQLQTGPAAHAAITNKPVTAFIFPGQGSQWRGMALELMQTNPSFQSAIAAFDRGLSGLSDWQVSQALLHPEDDSWLSDISRIQPTLCAVMIGLAACWKEQGVCPDYVVGHSMGEVAAAAAAELISIEEAARIISIRSKLLLKRSGQGLMLLVDLSEADVAPYITAYADRVSLAVINGPRTIVLSGEEEAIEELRVLFETLAIFCKLIRVDIASHSPQMDILLPELKEQLQTIVWQNSSIQMISTVTADVIDASELNADYWLRNLRDPVRYHEVIESLQQKYGVTHFIEMSPHPLLKQSTQEIIAAGDRKALVLECLRRDQDAVATLRSAILSAWLQGLGIDWAGLAPDGIFLPLFPQTFDRKTYWVAAGTQVPLWTGSQGNQHPILGSLGTLADGSGKQMANFHVCVERQPFLKDHQVSGSILAPMTLSIELFAATALHLAEGVEASVHLQDISIPRALLLNEGQPVQAQLIVKQQELVQFYSSDTTDHWTLQSQARIKLAPHTASQTYDMASLQDKLQHADALDSKSHQALMQAHEYFYGPHFQGLKKVFCDGNEVWAEALLPSAYQARSEAYTLCPMLMDAGLQAGLHALLRLAPDRRPLPIRIDELRIHKRPKHQLYAHFRIMRLDEDEAQMDAKFYNEAGEILVEWDALTFRMSKAPATRKDMNLGSSWFPTVKPQRDDQPQHILILAQDKTRADEYGVRLQELCPTSAFSVSTLAELPSDFRAYDRLLLLARGPGVSTTVTEELEQFLELMQKLSVHEGRSPILVVTEGCQQVQSEDVYHPKAASLCGFVRAIRHEQRGRHFKLIDLHKSSGSHLWEGLAAELEDNSEEDVCWRRNERYVRRLDVFREPQLYDQPKLKRRSTERFQLVLPKPGQLETAGCSSLPAFDLKPLEVEIAVHSVGLNFVDALAAMGQTFNVGNKDALRLGGELSGVVTRIADAGSPYKIGDTVVATAFGILGSHVKVPTHFVRPKPACLSHEQAASSCLAFMTAWYALTKRIQSRPGQSILIHAASGGLGLAAIQVARILGLHIFATAGSSIKRDYLRAMGIDHVFHSRDASFVDPILEATQGRGVDIVLNCLSGKLLQASLNLTAADGFFLEVGKNDIYSGRELNLACFKKALSFVGIDLAGFQAREPEAFAELLDEVLQMFENDQLQPLPLTVFDSFDLDKALRRFTEADHIGKIVVQFSKKPDQVWHDPLPGAAIDGASTYMITGGLGALGWGLVEALAAKGARHLILISRQDNKRSEELAALQKAGLHVAVWALDISDEKALEQRYEQEVQAWPPLKGIFHTAGILDDALLEGANSQQLQRIFAPKVGGAWNLHRLSLRYQLDLDVFVLYSSVASIMGLAGQSLYGAANAALDALAQFRRGQGLAATSVHFGVIGDGGLAAASEQRGERLQSQGLKPLQAQAVSFALLEALRAQPTWLSLCPIDAEQWLETHPYLRESSLWRHLLDHKKSGEGKRDQLLSLLKDAKPDDRLTRAKEFIRTLVGQVMRVDAQTLLDDMPLLQMGLDSLMSLELRSRLEDAFETQLSPTLLWTYPTVALLAPAILMKLGLEWQSAPLMEPKASKPLDEADVLDELASILNDV